ncbi:MAG: DUF4974 domain-containing protein [Muribaculaceae bacterium]
MKQDFDELFKVIDDAQSLSDSEIEKLVADLSDDERGILNAMIATKRAMQRNEAQKRAEQVADEAWTAFERQKFGSRKDIGNIVPMRHMWHKIAAAMMAVVAISGLTIAAVHSNWLHIDEAPEVAVEQEATAGHSGYTGHTATDTVVIARQVVILDDVTLEALLARMAAHYGAEVQFADDALRKTRLHFEWDKSLTLERNVQLLNNFSKFSVNVANDIIVVSNPEEK